MALTLSLTPHFVYKIPQAVVGCLLGHLLHVDVDDCDKACATQTNTDCGVCTCMIRLQHCLRSPEAHSSE